MVGPGVSRPVLIWLCFHSLGKSLFLLAEKQSRGNSSTLLPGDALHKFKWSNSYQLIQIWLETWQEELVISRCFSHFLHVTGKTRRAAETGEVGPLCFAPHQLSFLSPAPSLILFCQTSLTLSEGSGFLGEGIPPDWCMPAQPKGKTPMNPHGEAEAPRC